MIPVWSVLASRDMQELIFYIASDSLQNAELVRSRILKSVELLATMPHAGRLGRVSGTRELIPSNTPFVLVYRVETERIVILRVQRGTRQFP